MFNYEKIRPLIKSGDVVFFRGKGPGTWLIRTWTKSRWSHCGIAWVIGERVLLLEAHPFAGVRAIPMSTKKPDHWFQFDVWSGSAENVALETLGEGYGWWDCVRAGFGLPPRSDKSYQCAEYVIAVLKAAGKKCPEIATPEALFEWAEKCS